MVVAVVVVVVVVVAAEGEGQNWRRNQRILRGNNKTVEGTEL